MTDSQPASVDDVAGGLRKVGYLPGGATALVSYLAAKLSKPVLVEGPAGVPRLIQGYIGESHLREQRGDGSL